MLALQDALTVVDVSVVHPAAVTYVNAATRTKGSAATVGDLAKHVQYETSDLFGNVFVLFSLDTFDRRGKLAIALLNKPLQCASAGGVRCFQGCFCFECLHRRFVGLCGGIM